jgi:hypothetical protein
LKASTAAGVTVPSASSVNASPSADCASALFGSAATRARAWATSCAMSSDCSAGGFAPATKG